MCVTFNMSLINTCKYDEVVMAALPGSGSYKKNLQIVHRDHFKYDLCNTFFPYAINIPSVFAHL